MSANPTFLHKPYTGTKATNYEEEIAADNGAPTAGDVSVATVNIAPLTGVNAQMNRFGPRSVAISARFSGAGAATADVTAIYWQWSAWSSQWYPSNKVPLRGVDAVSATGGASANVDCNPNARKGYVEIDGLDGDEDVFVVVEKRS